MKSANKEVNGKFDYIKTPLAPLGTNGLVYNDPATRASWAPHGTNAYYLGMALKHFWCLRFYMPSPGNIRWLTRGAYIQRTAQPQHCHQQSAQY
jgi:hypothetical protein